MADQFVAEIRMFAGNFAPTGWAMCDGQLLPISQNTALFSLLGTNYGGDGRSTFGLPNLMGTFALHQGQGPGLSSYVVGQSGGVDTVTLLSTELPSHGHTLQASGQPGEDPSASGEVLARSVGAQLYQTDTATHLVTLDPRTAAPVGGSLPHNNLPPYLVLTFIIALQGIFPPRS